MLEVACANVLEAQERLEREGWVFEASVFGTRLHVVVADAVDGAHRAAETLEQMRLGPVGVERILPSLEDVFIHCIEAEETRRGPSLRAS